MTNDIRATIQSNPELEARFAKSLEQWRARFHDHHQRDREVDALRGPEVECMAKEGRSALLVARPASFFADNDEGTSRDWFGVGLSI